MGYNDTIETVADLLDALQHYDPDTPIRLAMQPSWAMEYTIGTVAHTPDDADADGDGDGDGTNRRTRRMARRRPPSRIPPRNRQQRPRLDRTRVTKPRDRPPRQPQSTSLGVGGADVFSPCGRRRHHRPVRAPAGGSRPTGRPFGPSDVSHETPEAPHSRPMLFA